jgi:hypothetical protein
MHIPPGAPSLHAAAELITVARDGGELGLADAVDLQTSTLQHQELIEVIAVLAATIERMARPIDDVLNRITSTERGGP